MPNAFYVKQKQKKDNAFYAFACLAFQNEWIITIDLKKNTAAMVEYIAMV